MKKEAIHPPAGYLEVGVDERFEVVINHPDLKSDKDGVGHITFSPAQARNLAHLLLDHADTAEKLRRVVLYSARNVSKSSKKKTP